MRNTTQYKPVFLTFLMFYTKVKVVFGFKILGRLQIFLRLTATNPKTIFTSV